MNLDFLFNLLELLGGFVISFAYVPQLRQIVRTKSVSDLNLKTFALIFIGVVCMELYAINLYFAHNSGGMFLVANTMSLSASGSMCVLILKYRKPL